MSSRRRANKGRSRAKANLDDLDGALTTMIGSHQDVKVTVDDPAEESRFTMHSSNDRNDNSRNAGIFASSLGTDPLHDMSGCDDARTPVFEKHQVNYSATKYIKP